VFGNGRQEKYRTSDKITVAVSQSHTYKARRSNNRRYTELFKPFNTSNRSKCWRARGGYKDWNIGAME